MKHPAEDSNNLNPAEQKSISTYFPPAPVQKEPQSRKRQRQLLHDQDISESEIREIDDQSSQAPQLQSKVPRTEQLQQAEQSAPTGTVPSEKLDLKLIMLKLDAIGQDIKDLKHEKSQDKISNVQSESSVSRTSSTADASVGSDETAETQLDKARSLQDIEEHGFGISHVSRDDKVPGTSGSDTEVVIFCKVCVDQDKLDTVAIGDPGIFVYKKGSEGMRVKYCHPSSEI